MNRMKTILFGIILLSYHGCYAYYYALFVKDTIINKQTNKRRVIVGVADYHLKTHPANKNQRVHIESQIKKCGALKGKLIVEDLSSINNDGKMICCNFGINCCEGGLGQLASKARSWGVAVDNVEYRYCRVAAIGPLLDNIKADPHSFKSSSRISTISLHKEVIDEIEKIKRYNDGKLLNDMYKSTAHKVHTALLKMGFNKNNVSVADYCKKLQNKEYRQALEKLCIFDSALVDMNIMHSIAKCAHEPLVFIIAGGSHIEQVGALLQRMGYTSIINELTPALPLSKKVLNSDCALVTSDMHPEPVDITILDKFMR